MTASLFSSNLFFSSDVHAVGRLIGHMVFWSVGLWEKHSRLQVGWLVDWLVHWFAQAGVFTRSYRSESFSLKPYPHLSCVG